jgi:hypothetical protein
MPFPVVAAMVPVALLVIDALPVPRPIPVAPEIVPEFMIVTIPCGAKTDTNTSDACTLDDATYVVCHTPGGVILRRFAVVE